MEIQQQRMRVWGEIPTKVTQEMTDSLLLPITKQEVEHALQSLSNSSWPGLDGLTPSFYKKYWEILKEDLIAAYQHVFDSGEMPNFLSEGLIYLIPKGEGISEDIRKWRPITLLNTSYKIFAKMLSFRLQKVLSKVIHVSQTGFMKDRSIVDNVFTFWETTALAVKKKQNLAVLLLDFEKAYDRVDWNFWRVLCIGWASRQHGLREFLVCIGMHIVKYCWPGELNLVLTLLDLVVKDAHLPPFYFFYLQK